MLDRDKILEEMAVAICTADYKEGFLPDPKYLMHIVPHAWEKAIMKAEAALDALLGYLPNTEYHENYYELLNMKRK